METMIKIFLIGKIKEFVTKEVYQKEIVMNGSKGLDKLDSLLDGFWTKAEAFIKRGREHDNKYVPKFIEEPIEEITEALFIELRNTLDLKKLVEDIVAEGKKETGKM